MIIRLEHAALFFAAIGVLGVVGAFLVWLAPDRALTVGRHARKPRPKGGST
ncbi:MAG TPA: hypothetical protein VKV34_08850 [Thermoleophilia bacterium]|nr:hypothetical protein [Thermoleophilia bacterium]